MDGEARIVAYLARFPGMFDDRDQPMPMLSYSDEANFISETTDIFEDETTRVLLSIRVYEAEIGIIDPSAVDDYRAWRLEWLTRIARPRMVKVDGKFVVYSFAEAARREQEQDLLRPTVIRDPGDGPGSDRPGHGCGRHKQHRGGR